MRENSFNVFTCVWIAIFSLVKWCSKRTSYIINFFFFFYKIISLNYRQFLPYIKRYPYNLSAERRISQSCPFSQTRLRFFFFFWFAFYQRNDDAKWRKKEKMKKKKIRRTCEPKVTREWIIPIISRNGVEFKACICRAVPRGNLPSVPIFETPTRSRHLYGYMQPRRKAYYRQSFHSFPNNGNKLFNRYDSLYSVEKYQYAKQFLPDVKTTIVSH